MSAGIWHGGQNWNVIGNLCGRPLDGVLTSPVELSADGSIIVGASYNREGKYRAFRWDVKNGMVDPGAMTVNARLGEAGSRHLSRWQSARRYGIRTRTFQETDTQEPRRAIWWRGAERLVHPMGWAGEAVVTNDVGSVSAAMGTRPVRGGHGSIPPGTGN